MEHTPRLMITPGEPAGIGPDIILQIAQQAWPAELIAVGDPELLNTRAKQLKLPIELISFDAKKSAEKHLPGKLKIIPVSLNTPCQTGQLNPDNARYVLHCLELATDLCLKNKAHALVTGPVQKSVINAVGIEFTGHTEFLAKLCKVDEAIMLFVAKNIKVALATTHISLAEVPKAITTKHLTNTLRILHRGLQEKFSIPHPKILVCGLNPHAGENGHLGREEIDVIAPVLKKLRAENMDVVGPLAADTVFTEKYLASADAILAMYHDQALPVVKQMSFGHAVNVTLGLPIVRTSVDHGTALDIAGTGKADAASLMAAIKLALKLV